MKIVVRMTSQGSAKVEHQYCCPQMQFAIENGYIDNEWDEQTGGLCLRQNPDLPLFFVIPQTQRVSDELEVKFCPFCGAKNEWSISQEMKGPDAKTEA